MRHSVENKLLKAIALQDGDQEPAAIKVCDLNLRMNQFNLRMRFTLDWRPSGPPYYKGEVFDIYHKPLFRTKGYDMNFLLHELLRWTEETFVLNKSELNPYTHNLHDQKDNK